MSKLNLDNNFYLEILSNDKDNKEGSDIKNLKLSDIRKNGVFLLKIDFNYLNKTDYKKVLRKLIKIKKIISNKKIEIGIKDGNKTLLGYTFNYNESNKEQSDFLNAVNAIFYKNRYEMYNYIYDNVCDYLDGFFYGKNYCDFKNNKCGEKVNTSSNIGCCRHYKNKLFGPLLPNNFTPCEYLKEEHTCSAKCLGCKLFTCDYLRKKGIRFKIKDILLLNVFFNPLQKYYIKVKVFTPKEKILKTLMVL